MEASLQVDGKLQEDCSAGLIAEGETYESVPMDTAAEDSLRSGEGKQRLQYRKEELQALRGRDHTSGRWDAVMAEIGSVADELYELDVGLVHTRHKNADRRQRPAKKLNASRAASFNEPDGDIHQELGYEAIASSNNQKILDHGHDSGSHPGVVAAAESELYEEDSDDEIENFQPRAFAVDGEPDFESGPPQDGWEYLRHVRWEAAQCPKVKVAKIDPCKLAAEQTPYMPSIPSVTPCAPHLLPSKEWETMFLADFSDLRMAVLSIKQLPACDVGPLPSIHSQAEWEAFSFGMVTTSPEEDSLASTGDETDNTENMALDLELQAETDEAAVDLPKDMNNLGLERCRCSEIGVGSELLSTEVSTKSISGNEGGSFKTTSADPSSSTGHKVEDMFGESRVPKPPLLGILLSLDEVSRASLFCYHVAWLERSEGLPQERALWLFALSAVVDKPLDAQTSAAFRALLRRCAVLRATKESVDDEELHMLNLMITIAGRYFGQSEDLIA